MTAALTREDVIELQRLVNEEKRRAAEKGWRLESGATAPSVNVYRLERLYEKLGRLACE